MPGKHDNNQQTGPPLACYANYFEVGHNAYEFLIDFGQFRPESEDVVLHTRIVVGPTHAKLLAEMFQGAVRQYEQGHGQIAAVDDSVNPLEIIHCSIPDFERRAVHARRAAVLSTLAEEKQSSEKR